jgi:hypothetical protein
MPRPSTIAIVADGRDRILCGSARQAGIRIRVRLMRRVGPILERAGFLGRMVVRFRISRFVRRQIEKRAPFQACYSTGQLEMR